MLIGIAAFKHKSINAYSKSGLYFDTIVSVTIYSDNAQNAESLLAAAMDLCAEYEKLFSDSIDTSDIHNINISRGQSTLVSPDTIKLLNKGLYYSELTDGRFDITIAPVTKLWDFHGTENKIPDNSTISAALKNVDYQNLQIDETGCTVTLKNIDSRIEIGSLAKGYIADIIGDYLEKGGIQGAIINMGGDMKLIGKSNSNNYFTIGVNDPNSSGKALFPVYLSNMAIATSGTYERSFLGDDGRLYHHIIDTNTGYPCDSDLVQATVICPDSVDADSLATICILYKKSEALSFIESLPDTEAALVDLSGSISYTSGMEKYLTIPK